MSRKHLPSERHPAVAESEAPGDQPRPAFHHRLSCQLVESFPRKLSEDEAAHLLSVVRAYTGREGTRKPSFSGLVWEGGYGGESVALTNEGGGTTAEVSINPVLPWIQAGTLGVVSGVVVAGVLEPITFGVFLGSVATGLGVGLGAGIALAKWTRKRVAGLAEKISQTMGKLGEWSAGVAGDERASNSDSTTNASASRAAMNVELIGALQDRREALGTRVTIRAATYSLAVGGTLLALLPTALQFTPLEYPLPWIIVGGLGWILVRVLRGLFRGIRDRNRLDVEIQALLDAPEAPRELPFPENSP